MQKVLKDFEAEHDIVVSYQNVISFGLLKSFSELKIHRLSIFSLALNSLESDENKYGILSVVQISVVFV